MNYEQFQKIVEEWFQTVKDIRCPFCTHPNIEETDVISSEWPAYFEVICPSCGKKFKYHPSRLRSLTIE